MADQMINQRPADQQGQQSQQGSNQERELTRRNEQGLSRYQGSMSPFDLMRRFTEDVDRMFSSFGFGGLGWPFERTGRELTYPGTTGTGLTMWTPSVDVLTRGDDLVVSTDLPGV